jgi:carbon storage regulator CsrA
LIGENIRIAVSRIHGDKVWISIDAPKDVPVHRDELAKLHRERLELAKQQTQQTQETEETEE